VDHPRSQTYRSWLLGEILLVCLLASGTALFAASDSLKSAYELHDARLAFDTAVAVVATFVCVLTSVRFLVEGRTLDLLLAAGFWSIALGTVASGLVPVLGGGTLSPAAAWQLVGARLLGAGLIAIAPYTDGRMAARRRSLVSVGVGVAVLLVVAAGAMRVSAASPFDADSLEGSYVRLAALLLTTLWLVALVGFALRYRRYARDLDSWMCLAATLAVFADLHLVLTPGRLERSRASGRLPPRHRLRRPARRRLAGDQRGGVRPRRRRRARRVAREIHDGLAQYLFAISTQVNMLETGRPLDEVLPR
jgi:signal transduction histidine kinase